MNFFYSGFFSCDLCKIIGGKWIWNLCKIIDSNFSKINGYFWGKNSNVISLK